ncbi:MAG TPA: pseudouridine-5'-phosphate glycosidase [Spirochaetia bacterium]|nr:pseudouridine-5'-phosphate glycosidase [Spirochaetia bacterium]
MNPCLLPAPEVAEALAAARPVLAFESTIISHGMPYPRNLETALAAEQIARGIGAVPATIAVMDGRIAIGLSKQQLERLAREKDVLKISRRDVAWALSRRRIGATTVSATMLAARLAGISVFSTGGLGGVHRGALDTFDISADLSELASTSVLVVSAGAKAILDLPRTLEVLETLGVPVLAYRTDEFPAFYSRSSGLPLSLRIDSPAEAAAAFVAQRRLGLPQGMLVANPVPPEWEIPRDTMDRWIQSAMDDLARRQISGKAVTPFLLSRIVELSDGKSLETNIQLFHSNVRLGAQIAVELGRQAAG